VEREGAVTLWLKWADSSGFRGGTFAWNLDREPSPTVMAAGLGGVGRHQYRLEEDGVTARDATRSDKPPYRVPSMDEIHRLPYNGRSVVSLFSGTGGSSLGYRLAGFRVVWANEFVAAARDCYRANFPDTLLDERDVRQVTPESILQAIGMRSGELDVLDGSPPCASFSMAGKRERDWGKVKEYSDRQQRTDDLFFEYARLLDGLQPKTFVAENVSGLVKGTAKGYFKEILARLKGCGYRVAARVLDAQWLGVPQMRQRLIFLGVREDLGREPAFPRPLPYRYSVRDALPHILRHGTAPGHEEWVRGGKELGRTLVDSGGRPAPCITARSGELNDKGVGWVEAPVLGRAVQDNSGFIRDLEVTDGPAPTVTVSPNFWIEGEEVEPEAWLGGLAVGREWDRIGPGGQSERYFQLVRPDPEAPCPTVTASGGTTSLASVTHPTERRKFTIAELKRICAFPDDFTLTGSYAQQWERLGRAVPPLMMEKIALVLRDEVLAGLP
jgi:DNA (cytosine-5)-methyltransferase 1